MVDFRYLKAFQATARHLNFTNAAKELKISVSALSRQIALLEQNTGELFIRNTRQVILTPLGKKLFTSAERFEYELADLDVAPAIRIGCLESVFEFVLVGLMERHPKLFDGQLDIHIGSPESLQEMANAGKLDLLLTNLKPMPSSALSGFRFYQESVSWIGQSSRSNNRSVIFSAFENYYSEESLQAKNRIWVNSFNATVELTKRNLGKALVALPVSEKSKKVNQGTQWIYVVLPNYRNVPPKLKDLVSMLREVAFKK